jgi:type I restriction enzyme M protein
MTSIQQRAALQSQIWKIANDVRGAVDGWDSKGYFIYPNHANTQAMD